MWRSFLKNRQGVNIIADYRMRLVKKVRTNNRTAGEMPVIPAMQDPGGGFTGCNDPPGVGLFPVMVGMVKDRNVNEPDQEQHVDC